MLDTFRPRLPDDAVVRRRSDGSAGVHDPASGRAVELAPDQVPLLERIDGKRSLSEIAEDHFQAARFVPFAALRDLLRSLGAAGLLANPPEELKRTGLAAARPPFLQREAGRVLAAFSLPAAGVWTVLGALLALAAAAAPALLTSRELVAADVLWAYAGAALALSARGFCKAAAVTLLGHPPRRLQVRLSLGVLHVAPDAGGAVLLDRRPRALAHLAALAGPYALAAGGGVLPGLAFGALAVLLVDLCPFAPTSAGKLLATAASKVDLREHARAYMSRRLLRRVTSSEFFSGEGSLILSSLLSLAWLSILVRLLLTEGAFLVLRLAAVGAGLDGPERLLAFGGAAVLLLLIPVSLVVMGFALVKAALALRPRRGGAGLETRERLELADLDSIPLFSRLGGEERKTLAAAIRELRYLAGSPIVVQGEAGDRFFAIRSGEVVVEVEDESGLTRQVAHLGPGDCFGETALLERTPRTATVRAVRETVVAELTSAAFERVRQAAGGVDVTALLRAAAALHHSPLFRQLPPDRLSALAGRLQPRQVAAGTAVVQAGEQGDEFYLVGSGALEVLDGAGAKIGALGPGDHFGEIALLRDVPRTATVRATEDSLVLALSKASFISGMSADLELSTRIEELAAHRAEAAR